MRARLLSLSSIYCLAATVSRDLFAQIAISQVLKILTLCDRNPHSPTYGCFDRNFWHYKTSDFPSGMSQEFVLPLALAYHTDLPGNPFYQEEAIRNWVEAGILYAAESSHKDGSCDDYFPFERAGGAAAFSLLACVKSYQLLGLDNYNALTFFEKRADWLANHHESGQLTNHQALIVLCLEMTSQLLKTSKWDRAKALRLEKVLDWQHDEGWFVEYEGFDPGYHTLTISCLAEYYQHKPDGRLREALRKAVALAAQFVHPDGSFGGEYGSRNTYNFFPHGFELIGQWMPEALAINDAFLEGLAKGLGPVYSDDRIVGHHAWNYLLAWQDFVTENRPNESVRSLFGNERVWLSEAQILVDRRSSNKPTTQTSASESQAALPEETTSSSEGEEQTDTTGEANQEHQEENSEELASPSPPEPEEESQGQLSVSNAEPVELYVALNKGGTFKLFRGDRLVVSDTQVSLLVRQGKKQKNAVAHLVGPYQAIVGEDEIVIKGQLGWAKQQQMTPVKNILLRLVMLSVGRFFPNLIRKLLQKMLITGKKDAPMSFIRRFQWENGQWHVTDTVHADNWNQVEAAGIGCDQTSIYVVMSRTFQMGQLQPWLDLTQEVHKLSGGDPLICDRYF